MTDLRGSGENEGAAASKRGRPSVARADRESIVVAALKIVDADGPQALNMRRLARELNLDSQGSIYNYFKSKGEVEFAVAQHIVADIRSPKITAGLDWQAWVIDAAAAYHRTLLQHPNAISLILELQPRTFGARVFAFAEKLMLDQGIAEQKVEDLFLAIQSLAAGSAWNAKVAANGAASGAERGAEPDQAALDRWFRRTCTILLTEQGAE